MRTSEITIRNGHIISSACDQCSDDPYALNPCDSELFCDETWTRFYQSNEKYGIQMATINDPFADFYDPLINGLISEQCSNASAIDVRLRSNKNDVIPSDYIVDLYYQEAMCKNTGNNRQTCHEFEIRFCCERNNQDLEWISKAREIDNGGGDDDGNGSDDGEGSSIEINLGKNLYLKPQI